MGLWIGLAAALAILIAAGLVLWLVVLDDDEDNTATATTMRTTSTTGPGSTTTSAVSTSAVSTSTSASTSTTIAITGDPGDSPGEWAEIDASAFPGGVYAVAVSDEAVLIDAKTGDGYALYAYMMDTGELVELPLDYPDFYDEDLEGRLAVWWEGTYQEDTDTYNDEHIYAYPLPDGPKVEVVAELDASYNFPQIAGPWITWAEGGPWQENPDEYWLVKIRGLQVNTRGEPEGDPSELVAEATSFALGDSTWTYSLSATHLAWENAATVGTYGPGSYVMDLGAFRPVLLGADAWRPSLGGDKVVYYDGGLQVRDLGTDQVRELDPLGDFAAAAPTFAVYFRAVESSDAAYEIVARGYNGAYEQVLGRQGDPPWLSPFLAVSANHVAFIIEDTLHVFEWKRPMTY